LLVLHTRDQKSTGTSQTCTCTKLKSQQAK
jgi:hypothetical protein